MFNWREAAAEVAEANSSSPGLRLPFPDQCAIFCSTKIGTKYAHIAKAFGVTNTTVSYIASCSKANPRRYKEIAREFANLGEEAFMDRYYSEDIHTRIMRIKYEAELPGDTRTRGAPNMNAAAKWFYTIGSFACAGEHWRIDKCSKTTRLPGWYFTHCKPNGDPVDAYNHRGLEALDGSGTLEQTPFRTSQLAYDAVFKMTGETP